MNLGLGGGVGFGASLPVTSCVVPKTACSAPGITCLAPARVVAVDEADEAATVDVDEPATLTPGDDGVMSSLTRLWLVGGTRGCFVFCRCLAAGLPVAMPDLGSDCDLFR